MLAVEVYAVHADALEQPCQPAGAQRHLGCLTGPQSVRRGWQLGEVHAQRGVLRRQCAGLCQSAAVCQAEHAICTGQHIHSPRHAGPRCALGRTSCSWGMTSTVKLRAASVSGGSLRYTPRRHSELSARLTRTAYLRAGPASAPGRPETLPGPAEGQRLHTRRCCLQLLLHFMRTAHLVQ